MSTTDAQPASGAPEAAPDPLVARAGERLAVLRELTEITMAVIRATARHTIEAMETPPAPEPDKAEADPAPAPAPAAPRRDPVEMIAKLSRIVRLTITLEAKLEDALRAHIAGEVAKAEAQRAAAAKDPRSPANDPFAPLKSGRKARARALVREVIDREIPDPEDADALIDALEERLLCDEAYENIEDVPLREIVDHLCEDLQLKPDWRRWTGEGWRPNPPFTRPLCSDFKAPSRRPILQDLPVPNLLE